jgi:putative FmdB family regulatory protein
MPVYEYACEDCGEFTAVRAMAQCRDPHPCPSCGEEAPRALVTAPAFAGLAPAVRRAHAVNERSAHEPRNAAGHGAGCACCSTAKSSAVQGADGSKAFPSKRPWMISH